MPISDDLTVAHIRDAILSSIDDKAHDFLDKHAPAKAFIEERGKRLGQLIVEYKKASAKDRKRVWESIELVRETIQLKAAELAIDATIEAKNWFSRIASLAFDVLVKNVPALLGGL